MQWFAAISPFTDDWLEIKWRRVRRANDIQTREPPASPPPCTSARVNRGTVLMGAIGKVTVAGLVGVEVFAP